MVMSISLQTSELPIQSLVIFCLLTTVSFMSLKWGETQKYGNTGGTYLFQFQLFPVSCLLFCVIGHIITRLMSTNSHTNTDYFNYFITAHR